MNHIHFVERNSGAVRVDISTVLKQVLGGFDGAQNDDDLSKNVDGYDIT
jgi:hypothetical protein